VREGIRGVESRRGRVGGREHMRKGRTDERVGVVVNGHEVGGDDDDSEWDDMVRGVAIRDETQDQHVISTRPLINSMNIIRSITSSRTTHASHRHDPSLPFHQRGRYPSTDRPSLTKTKHLHPPTTTTTKQTTSPSPSGLTSYPYYSFQSFTTLRLPSTASSPFDIPKLPFRNTTNNADHNNPNEI
jgi:hypothetical protein